MKKPSVFIIFLTVFIDLIGFGIVLPLLPIFAKNFHATGFVIGALMASFSAMQFFFAPLWGRLSDRVGRRPVLLVSTAGAAASYAIFAIGSGMSGQAGLARHSGTNCKNRVGSRCAGRAHQQDRATTNAVRQPAPKRGEEKLHGGKRRHQRADDETGGVKILGEDRQERQHDAKADQINEDGQKDDEYRWLFHSSNQTS